MPNTNRDQTPYIVTGDPDTMNVAPADFTIMRPGELGKAFDYNDRTYQIVKLDSGCVAGSVTGAVAANQLAFWKDRSAYLVTNWSTAGNVNGVANSYCNNVAGVFRNAATGGNYISVLQRGRNIAMACTSGTSGMSIEATPSVTTALCIGIAVGTQNTYQKLGVVTTNASANVLYASVDIPNIP